MPRPLVRLLALLLVALPASALRAAQAERPNVLLFVTDDHRADVLGCAGHPVVRTPHIDALAADGLRFANAFVTTPICAASRASILTGLVERTHRYSFGRPPLAAALCARSYPARLKAAGYRTGFVGKLGVKIEGGEETLDELFDVFVPLGRAPYWKTLEDGTRRHLTDLTGDRAIEFLRGCSPEQPFCLSVSFNAAHAEDGDLEDHYPFPPDEAGLYEGLELPRPRLDGGASFDEQPQYLKDSLNRERYFWRWDTPEKYQHNMRNYLRMLSGLDRNVGRVLDELEARGLADDTVVLVMGDNGYYMGERGFAGKWSHYDESLRVPLVVYDPRLPAERRGAVVDAFALNVDLAPTILALAAVEPDARLQGLSLLDLANGSVTRDAVFCEHRWKIPSIPAWEGLRTARYKYARYLGRAEDDEHLYELETDLDERVNLVASPEHRDTLRELRARCLASSRRYAAEGEPLPRVLMLGDSISMGYHPFVEDELSEEALVFRPAENCAGTTKGVERVDAWLALGDGTWDVIHVNFGLHDLKHVQPDGANSDDPEDPRQAEPEVYGRQLDAILAKLEATGAELVFATTTPFPAGVRPYREPADAARYNEVALRAAAAHGAAVDDLYAFALPRLEELQQPVNVHFTRAGSRELGLEVARHVRAALERAAAR